MKKGAFSVFVVCTSIILSGIISAVSFSPSSVGKNADGGGARTEDHHPLFNPAAYALMEGEESAFPSETAPAELPTPLLEMTNPQMGTLSFQADAASCTVTDADGQSVEKASEVTDRIDPLGRTAPEYLHQTQIYKTDRRFPLLVTATGMRTGTYNLEHLLQDRGYSIGWVPTEAGMVDHIRHDGDTLSITFDRLRQPKGSFMVRFFRNKTERDLSFWLFGLPVIPGATLSFTIDWTALSEDAAALTIAVDRDGDGRTDRSRKLKAVQSYSGVTMQSVDISKQPVAYQQLFGSEGVNPDDIPAVTIIPSCSDSDEDRDGYYIGDNPTTSECNARFDFKGVEKAICDCPELAVGASCHDSTLSEGDLLPLFDPQKITKPMRGRQFHPGVPDGPGNGIDEDCDGIDASDYGSGCSNERNTPAEQIMGFLLLSTLGISILCILVEIYTIVIMIRLKLRHQPFRKHTRLKWSIRIMIFCGLAATATFIGFIILSIYFW